MSNLRVGTRSPHANWLTRDLIERLLAKPVELVHALAHIADVRRALLVRPGDE